MKTLVLAVSLGVSLVVAGCARVATTTEIAADGSFVRKSVYTVVKSPMSGMGDSSGKSAPDKPEDFFRLPANSPQVKVVKTQGEQDIKIAVSRALAAGSPSLQDVTILAEKGKVMATSAVTVRRLPDGTIEYVETLHALSPSSEAREFVVPELRARVKTALPVEFQKTELIDKATAVVMVNVAHGLFGPPEPNLFNMMLSPEGTERRVDAFIFRANITGLREAIPGMSEDQAQATARGLLDVFNEKALQGGSSSVPGASTGSSGPNGLTPLYFDVKFKGKVVETNGLVDPVTGDVYWTLLAPILDLGDVRLRLVIRP